jgi:hypothetical protein
MVGYRANDGATLLPPGDEATGDDGDAVVVDIYAQKTIM